MIISPFTPLFFSPSTDKFGAKSKYVQLFARTDRIFVELILTAKEQEPIVYINNLLSNISTPVSLSSWKMNDDKILYFYNISLLPCGYYTVTVNGNTSEIFKVTDDECELSETSLIQYSMKDNKQRLDAEIGDQRGNAGNSPGEQRSDDAGEDQQRDAVANAVLCDALADPHRKRGAGRHRDTDDAGGDEGRTESLGLHRAHADDQTDGLDEAKDDGGITGVLRNFLAAFLAFLLEFFQFRNGDGQQLNDNG